MAVVGVAEVEAAKGKVFSLKPGDILTPLARDRAKELGVVLQSGAPGVQEPTLKAAREVARPAQEISNALYRRGAPVVPREWQVVARSADSDPRLKVAVIGAGHVGATTALFLAEADAFAKVVLVDIVPGLAAGIALDLWHSAALKGFTTRLEGSTEIGSVAGCSYVVITAGKPRQPGMSRTDLTQVNAAIVAPIAEQIARYAPDSVIVVVTNPLEEMTHLACRASKFPAQRVIGMAGVLDSARFSALVGLAGVAKPEEISAVALGSHGPEMVIPLSQASVGGQALEEMMDRGTLDAIVERTRHSGAEVVQLLQTGSAYFAPAASSAAMILAMAQDAGQVMAACVEPNGAYQLNDVRIGLPVKLGHDGVAEVVTLDLRPEELAALRAAAGRIAERIAALG